MKHLYKGILQLEGGKRNLTAADVSEILRHLAVKLTSENSLVYLNEFERYLAKVKGEKPFFKKKVKWSAFIGFRGTEVSKRKKRKKSEK